MPMDIRSFFKTKPKSGSNSSKDRTEKSGPASSEDKKSKTNSRTGNNKKVKSSSSSDAATATKQGTTKAASKPSSTTSRKVGPAENNDNHAKKRRAIEDSSDDDTDIESRPHSTGKKDTTVGSSASAAVPKASGTKRKTNPADDDDDEVVEISPQDFFNKSPSPKKKKEFKELSKPVKDNDIWDEDFDEPYENAKETTRSSPKNKKSTSKKRVREDEDESDTDFNGDDDDDGDYEEDEKGGDDDDDEDFLVEEKPKPRRSPYKSPAKTAQSAASPVAKSNVRSTPPSSKKQPTKSKATPSRAKKSPAKPKKTPPIEPSLELENFDMDSCVVPECLEGLTFVFTGMMENLSREEGTDLVKCLGGRVTGQVSSKTTYLVVGETLEDGRHYTEGSKYKKATESNSAAILVLGEKKLYGLFHQYQERAKEERGISDSATVSTTKSISDATRTSAPLRTEGSAALSNANTNKPGNPYAKKAASPAANPYAKKTSVVNPYSRNTASNPYAKSAGTNPKTKSAASSIASAGTPASASDQNNLWVDKHAPQATRDILGNKENIQKLSNWLAKWEKTFLDPKNIGKTFSNPKGPWKAALLSGPPGIGKTTTATLVIRESGRDLLEFNASDARSKKTLKFTLGSVADTDSITKTFVVKGSKQAAKKLKCVIMDEVDGMGAGDRSGMAELIQMIKHSKVPIICICNDRQSQKMKSLLPYCMDLRFKRPVKSVLANRAVRIAQMEGLTVERNAAEAIAESCGNDVRQVFNCLQMWANKKGQGGKNDESLTYKVLKEREKTINKDEILRVSLFDAAKTVMEGPKNLSGASAKAQVDSLYKRSDAFFVDYSLVGLLVQQNYLKVMQPQLAAVRRTHDPHKEQEFLERVHDAASSMSDYAMMEQSIRGGDQNWSLLPASGMLTVKTGYHAGGPNGGFLPGFPEFTSWMGKNSSKGKKLRLLQELHHHMNYKIGGGTAALRESYLPVLRQRFMTLLRANEDSATKEAIELMDAYGLSRDDIMEKLDEFKLLKNEKTFADLDSKHKAAFTREYNQGSHTSQALVWEQAGPPSKRSKKGAKGKEVNPADLDAIDDDVVEDESDDDEEEDLKKLKEKFKAKGRRKAKGSGTKKSGGRKKK